MPQVERLNISLSFPLPTIRIVPTTLGDGGEPSLTLLRTSFEENATLTTLLIIMSSNSGSKGTAFVTGAAQGIE